MKKQVRQAQFLCFLAQSDNVFFKSYMSLMAFLGHVSAQNLNQTIWSAQKDLFLESLG